MGICSFWGRLFLAGRSVGAPCLPPLLRSPNGSGLTLALILHLTDPFRFGLSWIVVSMPWKVEGLFLSRNTGLWLIPGLGFCGILWVFTFRNMGLDVPTSIFNMYSQLSFFTVYCFVLCIPDWRIVSYFFLNYFTSFKFVGTIVG